MRCPLCQVGHLDGAGRCPNCNTEPRRRAQAEAPRSSPVVRVEAPRSSPVVRVEAPRSSPGVRVEAPRSSPGVRVEAPRSSPGVRVEAPRLEAQQAPPARARRCPSCSEVLPEPVPTRCPSCQRLTRAASADRPQEGKVCGHCGTPNPPGRAQCTLCYHGL